MTVNPWESIGGGSDVRSGKKLPPCDYDLCLGNSESWLKQELKKMSVHLKCFILNLKHVFALFVLVSSLTRGIS